MSKKKTLGIIILDSLLTDFFLYSMVFVAIFVTC